MYVQYLTLNYFTFDVNESLFKANKAFTSIDDILINVNAVYILFS